MKNLRNLGLAITALFAIISCSSDDDATFTPITGTPTSTPKNIVETAQATSNLSLLVDAVIKADLVTALSASGNKTVFAPTNAAFTTFLANKGFADLDAVPVVTLKQILLNHVIDGSNLMASDLANTTGYAKTLADGPEMTKLSIYYDGNSGVELNGTSSVTTADVSATNGIIHIVNTVIDLPTIATFATTNPALSLLVDTMTYADTGTPTVPYITTVADATAGPFTVFAPTNAAFGNLLTELSVTALTDIPTATVDAVLLLHIVNIANVESTELTDGTVVTLGGNLTVDATAFTLTDPLNRVTNIVTSLVDIQATNGVVHVVDQVLRP